MSDADVNSEQAHLSMLVAKHQEQAQLFYSRVQVLLVVYGFLFAAAGVVIASETLRSDVAYASLALLMLVGTAFSFTWKVVISESNDWIRFWEAKILLFELKLELKRKEHLEKEHLDLKWDFFLDRARIQNDFPDAIAGYSLDKTNEALKLRWRGATGAYEGGGIGKIFQIIPYLMGILWLILLLVVCKMWVCGISLHESRRQANNAMHATCVDARA